MFGSTTASSFSPSPDFSPLCARRFPRPDPNVGVYPERLGAFGSPAYVRSRESSDPRLSPPPLPSNSLLSRSSMALGCALSTVSRFTLSTKVDVVDAASSISPVFATLTENTGGGVPLAHSLPRLVILPALTAAERGLPTDLPFHCSRHTTHHSRPAPPYHPLFSYSYALFCTAQSLKPFPFSNLRTLYPKHPGGGIPSSSFRHSEHCKDMSAPEGFLREHALSVSCLIASLPLYLATSHFHEPRTTGQSAPWLPLRGSAYSASLRYLFSLGPDYALLPTHFSFPFPR